MSDIKSRSLSCGRVVLFRALDPRLFIDARRALSGSNTGLFTRGSRVFDITQRTTSRGLRLRDQTMLLGGYTYLLGGSSALEAARHVRNRQRTPKSHPKLDTSGMPYGGVAWGTCCRHPDNCRNAWAHMPREPTPKIAISVML